MNKDVVIVLQENTFLPVRENCDYIGVERGCLSLIEKKLPFVAVGDFDSTTEEERKWIATNAKEMVKLNPVKNDSDSEHALLIASQRGYRHFYMISALGRRIDHEVVNLRLTRKYCNQLILEDSINRIFSLSEGSYDFQKQDYHYFSLFAWDKAKVTLKGFVYPLNHVTLTSRDLYGLSNEIQQEKAQLIVEKGQVLVIRCKA